MALVPLLLVRVFWRGRRDPSQRASWRERLGIYGNKRVPGRPVWIHAVSVGESVAAAPLVRALNDAHPQLPLVATTTTTTGAASIERLFADIATHVYFPYDVPAVIERFIERFRPRALLILETELWPNTLAACARHDIPVLLVNARMSEKSLRGYVRVPGLAQELMRGLSLVAAQGQHDAARFGQIASNTRIETTGSLKFDIDLPASLFERAEALRRELGVNRRIVTCGSTRDGEERVLFEVLERLQSRFADVLFVIAPRHPERFDDVAQAAVGAGLRVARRSRGEPCSPATTIYLLDAMGELPAYYAAGDVAFVGGSLKPYGGHNVLEPAALGRPVVSGPHTHNFAEITSILRDAGALYVADGADELATGLAAWLGDSNERDRVGRIARELVRHHRGATRKTLELVEQYLQM